MPNQILEDVIYTGSKFFDSRIEYPIEQEILLADYDRPIFKIVRTQVTHTITQKYINGNKLVVEGFFRTSVFYQPPAGANLTVITKKLPFSKQFELGEAVTGPHYITINGRPRYINTRAVNPTRVDIRGIYNLDIQGITPTPVKLATAVNSADVCTDTGEITHFALIGRSGRQFSTEEEINIPGREKILDITARNNSVTFTAYNDKVSLKGEITAEILYTTENSNRLNKARKTFAYNQVADLPGCKENSLCYGYVTPMSFTVTQNPEKKGVNCIFTANADITAYGKTGLINVSDGFSKKYSYSEDKTAIEYRRNICSINKSMSVTVEDTVPAGYEACHCFRDISNPVVSRGEDSPVLKAKISVSVIVKNSGGEYDCFTKTEDIYFNPGTRVSEENSYFITPRIKDCSANISADSMKAKVDFTLTGYEIVKTKVNTLSFFEENTEKLPEDRENALVLYYGEKGERLFDIALKYKTDVKTIQARNNTEGKILAEDKMLFIPAYNV